MAGTTRKVERKAAPKASADAAQEGAGEADGGARGSLRARGGVCVGGCRVAPTWVGAPRATGIARCSGRRRRCWPRGRSAPMALGATREWPRRWVRPAGDADVARSGCAQHRRGLQPRGLFDAPLGPKASSAKRWRPSRGRGTRRGEGAAGGVSTPRRRCGTAAAAEVRRAAEWGGAVAARRRAGRKSPVDRARGLVALRDRLWTLRRTPRGERWARAGLGEAGEHVPGLQARVLGPRRKGTAGT